MDPAGSVHGKPPAPPQGMLLRERVRGPRPPVEVAAAVYSGLSLSRAPYVLYGLDLLTVCALVKCVAFDTQSVYSGLCQTLSAFATRVQWQVSHTISPFAPKWVVLGGFTSHVCSSLQKS